MNPTKIEIPELLTANPEAYCRFCCSDVDLRSIFPCNGEPLQEIISLLERLADIRLTVSEDFPCAVCERCLNKLEEFDHFRRRCQIYNDEIRKRRLESAMKNEPVAVKDEPMEHHDEEETEVISDKSNLKVENRNPKRTPLPKKISNNRASLMAKLCKSKRKNARCEKLNLEDHDYRCKVCEKFFTSKESINLHMKVHVDSVNLRCLNCSQAFETCQGLVTHAIQNYILTSFMCRQCDKQFKSKDKLLTHEFYCEKKSSKTIPRVSPKKAEKCDQCPKSFDTRHGLKAHMTLHETSFLCKKCGVDLPSDSLLKSHDKRYHWQGSKEIASTVKCDPCQRTFVDASAYRSHLTRFHQHQEEQIPRKLDEQKLYECDQCGKRFWSINTIRYHVLVHRKYRQCGQCAEIFVSREELRQHKWDRHPVVCDFCPEKFSDRKAQRSHANQVHGKVHVEMLVDGDRIEHVWRELLYRCASCGENYDEFRLLEDHFRKMHPKEKLRMQCIYCSKTSTSRLGYVGHLVRNCGKTPKKLTRAIN